MKLLDLFLRSTGVSTDTRNIKVGNIFFALKGDNFNGNLFATKAIDAGASYVVVDEEVGINDKFVKVDNVLESLQQLAKDYRTYLDIPVLAITGSNGKTTSKELIAAVLSKKYNLNYTKGNLNNEIGVPLTILSTKKENNFLIVEMGANHQGEIAFLSKIAKPNYGYITNIGKAHLEGFGGIEGVIKGKTELFKYIEESKGSIFYNAEDEKVSQNIPKNVSTIKFFTSDFKIDSDFPYLHLKHIEGFELKSNLAGVYNISNISAAYAIGKYFEISSINIIDAIESYIPSNNRSQIVNMENGIKLIKDAYNANPSSVMSSLNSLLTNSNEDKILVLGDMLELGTYTNSEHKNILDFVSSKNVFEAIFIGSIYYSFKEDYPKFKFFKTSDDCKSVISIELYKNKTILLKGSRGIALEKILE
jgi:UDP-N-acetylmuramoyl-tripeptide--D-alanyl-D-alanine ligase